MKFKASVDLEDLLHALEWVSGDISYDNAAFISRASGKIFLTSGEFDMDLEGDDAVPDDVEDEALYAPVPNKRDLELGQPLVFRFVQGHMPDDYETVSAYFRKRGAWSQFKNLLDRRNALDAWHEYESQAVVTALRDWCDDQGLRLDT